MSYCESTCATFGECQDCKDSAKCVDIVKSYTCKY